MEDKKRQVQLKKKKLFQVTPSSVSLNYKHIPDSFYNKINNKSKYNSDSDVLFTWKYYFSLYTQNIHILFNCVIAISLWLVVKCIGNFIWVKIVSMLQWEKNC